MEDAGNYCRNPTNDAGGEFCFTVANNDKVFCDIPDCEQGRGKSRKFFSADGVLQKQLLKTKLECLFQLRPPVAS